MNGAVVVLALMLIASPVYAFSPAIQAVMGASSSSACTSVTVDLDYRFETVPDSGSWAKVDTGSKLSASATGEQTTIKCAGGTADVGTNGMKYTSGAATNAYVEYTFASAKTGFSAGFWYKTGSVTSWATGPIAFQFCEVSGCASGASHAWYDTREMGGNTRQLGHATPGLIGISDNTWYWVTIKWVRNAASSWALYDTAGNQVGATQDWTGFDADAAVVMVGIYSGTTDLTSDVYWDDLWIDWTDSTFPLAP